MSGGSIAVDGVSRDAGTEDAETRGLGDGETGHRRESE